LTGAGIFAAPTVYGWGFAAYNQLSLWGTAASGWALTQSQITGSYLTSYGNYYLGRFHQVIFDAYLQGGNVYNRNIPEFNSLAAWLSKAPNSQFRPRDPYLDLLLRAIGKNIGF
jgi:hypothetical protein